MTAYPLDAAERHKARANLRPGGNIRERIQAAHDACTAECNRDLDFQRHGCSNDGTGCLCPCHDRTETK